MHLEATRRKLQAICPFEIISLAWVAAAALRFPEVGSVEIFSSGCGLCLILNSKCGEAIYILPFEAEECSLYPGGTVICELSCSINLCSVLLCSEAGGQGEREFRVQGSPEQSCFFSLIPKKCLAS